MSKRIEKLMTLFAFAAVPLAAACARDAGDVTGLGGPGPAEVLQMTVEPARVMLKLGQAKQLQAEMTNHDGTPLDGLREPVQWRSSAPDVATVSEAGLVIALAPGNAVITADCGEHYASASVTVVSPRHIDPPILFTGANGR